MIFKDQIQQELVLDDYPKRIISLVPSQTELLVDLGLEDNIVGITKFCVNPKHLDKEKTIIGGTKKVNFRKISNLKPDLIIGNKEENTEEMVNELEEIAPVYISNIITIEDMCKFILDIGLICNIKKESTQLVNKIDKELDNFVEFVKTQPVRKVAYFIWNKPWMVVGSDNYINEILKLNKFENIFANAESRYPDVYVEFFSDLSPELQPDLILLPSEPYPFKKEHIKELHKHIKCDIKLIDGEMFSWYGSRLLKAFGYFKKLHSSLT